MIDDNENKKVIEEDNLNIIDDTEEIEQDYELLNEDELNINISLDDIKELTEEEAAIVAQKVEVEIEKYEDMLVKAEKLVLTEEELIELGYDDSEYRRLKMVEKSIYQHVHQLHKANKNKNFFSTLPIYSVIWSLITIVFNIIPVNPYLPTLFIQEAVDKSKVGSIMKEIAGAYIVYFGYVGFFYLILIGIFVYLLIKGLKSKEKMLVFKSYLVLFVITIIMLIPGLILFLSIATKA